MKTESTFSAKWWGITVVIVGYILETGDAQEEVKAILLHKVMVLHI